MSDQNCIFCKIIAGEIPSYKIYEDSNFLAFLDIHPVKDGHTLLIPKKHVEWMHQADDGLISGVYIKTKELMQNLIKKLPCDYVQISVVGKDVPHFHIHLIPRHYDDGLVSWPTYNYQEGEAEKILQKLS